MEGGGVDVADVLLPSRSTATCTPPRALIGVTELLLPPSFAVTSMGPGVKRAGEAGGRNGMNDARDGDAGGEGEKGVRAPTTLRAPRPRTLLPGAPCTHLAAGHDTVIAPVSMLMNTTFTRTFSAFIVAPM